MLLMFPVYVVWKGWTTFFEPMCSPVLRRRWWDVWHIKSEYKRQVHVTLIIWGELRLCENLTLEGEWKVQISLQVKSWKVQKSPSRFIVFCVGKCAWCSLSDSSHKHVSDFIVNDLFHLNLIYFPKSIKFWWIKCIISHWIFSVFNGCRNVFGSSTASWVMSTDVRRFLCTNTHNLLIHSTS